MEYSLSRKKEKLMHELKCQYQLLDNLDFSRPLTLEEIWAVFFQTDFATTSYYDDDINNESIRSWLVQQIHPLANFVNCTYRSSNVNSGKVCFAIDTQNGRILCALQKKDAKYIVTVEEVGSAQIVPETFEAYCKETQRYDYRLRSVVTYKCLLERHAGWKALATCRKCDCADNNTFELFVWWFFRTLPHDLIHHEVKTISWCRDFIKKEAEKKYNVYVSMAERYNSQIRLYREYLENIEPQFSIDRQSINYLRDIPEQMTKQIETGELVVPPASEILTDTLFEIFK